MNRYKTRSNLMLSRRDSLQLQGHVQAQNEGIEKVIPDKWIQKNSRGGSYT